MDLANNRYDLHTHSYFSDGTTSPEDIAEQVAAAGLYGFALTDHDTFAGVERGKQAAANLGLDFLTGVELTTKMGDLSPHLLGYGIHPDNACLNDKLVSLRQARLERVKNMVELLEKDFAINWQSLQEQVSGDSIGRPHIADALVRIGAVADRAEAFATVLHEGSKYYLPGVHLPTIDAVELVVAAGGAAVLAHPAAVRNSRAITSCELAELVTGGLCGVELRHPENAQSLLPAVVEVCAQFDLLVTGSSDFHGAGKPNFIGQETTDGQTVALLREKMR